MMKHFLNRVFNYKNTSLGAQSTLNSGKYWTKLNSTGTKSFTSSFDEELFHNLGKLFLAYWHKPSMVSLIISLNIIHVCMQFSTRPKNWYLYFCFNSFGAKKQQIAIFEEQFR